MNKVKTAMMRRINSHLATIEYPAETWAETAAHLAADYDAELAAVSGGGALDLTPQMREDAYQAVITRFEESLTDVS